jgi:hypothetical protein
MFQGKPLYLGIKICSPYELGICNSQSVGQSIKEVSDEL